MDANGSLLFVEDSDEDFSALRRVFAVCTDDLRRWETGEDALRELATPDPPISAPLVLLVDLHLPGIDGHEVIRRARQLPATRGAVICMLSSSRSPADAQTAIDAGADHYIIKPDNLKGLRSLPAKIAKFIPRS